MIACPGEPPVRGMQLGDSSYTRRVKSDFVLNFVAMATGLVVVEFVWHHSIAHPRIPPNRRKQHHDIFYTSGVIACFVPNFLAMATRVGRCKIWLTSFNSPTPKTPCYTQRSPGYLLHKPSYSRFCPKFRCHGNRGNPGVNLNDAIKQVVPENPTLESKITTLSCIQPELWEFKKFLNFPIGAIVKFRLLRLNNLVKF